MSKEVLHGNVQGFMETGTEGMDWTFTDESRYEFRRLLVGEALSSLTVSRTVYFGEDQAEGVIVDIPKSIKEAANRAQQRIDKNSEGIELFKLVLRKNNAILSAWQALPKDERRVEVLFADKNVDLVYPGDLAVKQYGYEALHFLNNGDELVIFDRENRQEVVWEGVVDLQERKRGEGSRIHPAKSIQHGFDLDDWVSMFTPESPAQLTRAV